ncbi:carboxypeptidase-like regulatory domain-containing protein [Desulfobacterota bacterium M19]
MTQAFRLVGNNMKKNLYLLLFFLVLGVSGAVQAMAAELYGWYKVSPRADIPLLLCLPGGKSAAETVTDNKGYYRFRGISPGEYRITVDRSCQVKVLGWHVYVTPGYSRFDLP